LRNASAALGGLGALVQIDSRLMAQASTAGGLEEFAEAEHLDPGTGGALPAAGSLLERSGLVVDGAARGMLPGGREGTVLLTTYKTTSDDHTTTHHHTAVVMRVPEAMGYAPYLQMGRANGLQANTKIFEPVPGVSVRADEGVDEGWLTELFSPALCEWLSRSPGDFGAELSSGVLTVIRDEHLRQPADLRGLCTDAAKVADAIREEAVEEVESGGGAVAKAAAPTRDERLAAGLIPKLGVAAPPAHVESEMVAGREAATHSGAVLGSVIRTTLLIIVGVNVIGGGIYGLLLNLSNPKLAVLIYQGILLLIVTPLVYRSRTSKLAKRASEEAFYLGYAKARDLKPVEPLRFAAEYGEAGLPAKPVRVFEGLFGGTSGHLMLTGNGLTRGDQIVLVRGPKGPTATTELNVSPPGVSTTALDECVQTLLLDLETAPSTSAAPAADAG
jgi:hypothetical protein